MSRSRAQDLLAQIDEFLPVGAIAGAAIATTRAVTTHRTRTKYGLHGHIDTHRQNMEKIRAKDVPGIQKKKEYKALRQKTVQSMSQRVHDLRTKHDLKTNPHKEKRIANRAFHGTLSGAPSVIFRNTPEV